MLSAHSPATIRRQNDPAVPKMESIKNAEMWEIAINQAGGDRGQGMITVNDGEAVRCANWELKTVRRVK